MFDKFEDNLSKDEKEFIGSVDAGTEKPDFYTPHLILSYYYLAKQIEIASISSDKSAKAIKWLTFGLVFVGICQVIVAIIK